MRACFQVQADLLEAWVREHEGALPRQNSKDVAEKRLARWINRLQQTMASRGSLPAERLQRLVAIPGMQQRVRSWESLLILRGGRHCLSESDFETTANDGKLDVAVPAKRARRS